MDKMLSNPNESDMVAEEQPEHIAATLDALPGLIGAIDRALFDVSGQKMPFMLVVFGENGAMHATNVQPVADAFKALKELADSLSAEV